MNIKLFILGLCIFLASCSSTVKNRKALSGDELILQQMKEGLTALYAGDISRSMVKFGLASEEVNKIWVDTTDAQLASSLWYNESAKKFKGEPYERMMLDYYLGSLYFNQQDYGNAQAAYKQALLNDAFGSPEVDFRLLLLLEGIALHYLGSTSSAQQYFDEYKEKSELPFSTIPNFIVLFETGYGPAKDIDDETAWVTYKQKEKNSDAVFKIEDAEQSQQVVDNVKTDVYSLAISRGIRKADEFNEKKEGYKNSLQAAGAVSYHVGSAALDVSVEAGKYLRSDDKALGVLFLVGVGAIFLASGLFHFADSILSNGDTRYWDNLPGNIHAAFFNLSAGDHLLVVEHFKKGKLKKKYNLPVSIKENKPQIIWLSSEKR